LKSPFLGVSRSRLLIVYNSLIIIYVLHQNFISEHKLHSILQQRFFFTVFYSMLYLAICSLNGRPHRAPGINMSSAESAWRNQLITEIYRLAVRGKILQRAWPLVNHTFALMQNCPKLHWHHIVMPIYSICSQVLCCTVLNGISILCRM
jgi:hypothetical protein